MTVTIDIHLHPEDGPIDKQLDDTMAALGFVRATGASLALSAPFTGQPQTEGDVYKTVAEQVFTQSTNDQPADAPKRVRGQPSPGKARRTKAEIAEDDAADKATGPITIVSQTDVTVEESNLVEDSPEVQAADAADEAAAAKADGKLTLDDVRNALGGYVNKFGMAAAQADGPQLIAKVLGVAHDPAAPKKISDLGDDQVLLKRAVDGVAEMIAKDPFKRGSAVQS